MRALLDTPALIWALTDPQRLGDRARTIIASRENELLVSTASAWEIATKVRIGRLPGAEPLVDGYHDHLDRLGARELPIDGRHALLAGSLRWSHRDPFDRVLAAQAVLEGLLLLTRDTAFEDLAGLRSRW